MSRRPAEAKQLCVDRLLRAQYALLVVGVGMAFTSKQKAGATDSGGGAGIQDCADTGPIDNSSRGQNRLIAGYFQH
jgi:hypothetical protein